MAAEPAAARAREAAAKEPVGGPAAGDLDLEMEVTSPASWWALGSFGAVIVSVVVLSVVARIPERVDGSGILLSGTGIKAVEAPAEGVVRTLEVGIGDLVREGQVVATLELAELASEIRVTRDRVAGMESDYVAQSAARQRLAQDRSDQIGNLRTRRRRMQELVSQGIRTPNEIRVIDKEIADLSAQLHQLTTEDANQRQLLDTELRRLTQLEERREAESNVRSRYAGRVAAVLKPAGQRIGAGEKLVNLEDPDAPLRGFVFLPFAQGQRVRVGDPVKVRPATVKSSEYGHIEATVEEKSMQPVTFEEVRSLLQNEELARRYVRDTPYRILVRLHLDPSCPGGLKWTSACGPPEPIRSNTPCFAEVIVKKKRPIQYVIPLRADDRQRAAAG